MKSALCLAFAALLISSCAGDYEPLIDTKGADMSGYQANLEECRKYAEDVDTASSAGKSAVMGGLVSAALGAAVGAIFGDPASGAAAGAITGAGGGALKGAGDASAERSQIVRNCLAGRGYKVLK